MMSEFMVSKGPERLAEERLQIARLTGEELFSTPIDDPEIYVARSQFAAHALSAIRRGVEDDFNDEEVRLWIGAANSLQDYVKQAEDDPEASSLRPGQIPLMRAFADYFELDAASKRGGHVVLPTGVGKTVIFTEIIHATGLRTLVVVPTKDLVGQTHHSFQEHARGREIDIGFVYQDNKQPGKDVTITTYDSLNMHANIDRTSGLIDPEDYSLVVYDEVHMLLGEKIRRATKAFPHAIQVGFTATDKYSEDKQVANILPIEIVRMDIIEGQDKRLVAPHHNIVVKTNTDMRNVRVASTGEYAQDTLYETIDTDVRNQVVVDTLMKLFPGKKAVAFCGGVAHAKHIAEKMRDNGVAADFIHGDMTMTERREVLRRLKLGSSNGGIDVITNDRVIGVGFDEDTFEVALLAAPTLSPLKLMQNAGRVTRLMPGKPDKVGYVVQFVDDAYVEPPIIYAEEVASGYAQHGWDGFEFPDLDHDVRIEDAEIIIDPGAIAEFIGDYDQQRMQNKKFQEPHDGWLSIEEAAELIGRPRNRIYSVVSSYRQQIADARKERMAAGETIDDLFDIDAHAGRFRRAEDSSKASLYVSPELLARLEPKLLSYQAVPSPLWRSKAEIAALYDRSGSWVVNQFISWALQRQYPSEMGNFVNYEGTGSKQNFFSPDMIRYAAAHAGIEDYSEVPPPDWVREEDARLQFGDAAFEVAHRRAGYQISNITTRRQNLLYELDGELERYYSPAFLKGMKRTLYFSDPLLRGLNFLSSDLAELDITAEQLHDEIVRLQEITSTHIDYLSGYYLNDEGELEYFCSPKLAAHIRERVIRNSLEGVIDASALQELLRKKEALRHAATEGIRFSAGESVPSVISVPRKRKTRKKPSPVSPEPQAETESAETSFQDMPEKTDAFQETDLEIRLRRARQLSKSVLEAIRSDQT